MINIAYHWLVILLLRPLFRPGVSVATPVNSTDPEGHAKKSLQTIREAAAAQCPSSANQIVRLLDRYDALYGLRFSSLPALQMAYTAGLVHLGMYFAASTPGAREKSRSMVDSCITILEKTGQTWAAGLITSGILRRMLENGERRMIGLPPRPRGENLNQVPSSESSAQSTSPLHRPQSRSGVDTPVEW